MLTTDNFDKANNSSDYRLDVTIPLLTEGLLARHSSGFSIVDPYLDVQPQGISINAGVFFNASRTGQFPVVSVQQSDSGLLISCPCTQPKTSLCDHQAQVLSTIVRRRELRLFFDPALRHDAIKQVAKDYGLENEPLPDDFFRLEYVAKSVRIVPKQPELMPLTPATRDYLAASLLPKSSQKPLTPVEPVSTMTRILVFTKHRHYDSFCLDLFEGATSRDGRVKNPLVPLQPLDLAGQSATLDDVKFYAAVARFQLPHRIQNDEAELAGLKIVVDNSPKLAVFYHSTSVSENCTAKSLVPVQLKPLKATLSLHVRQIGAFYDIWGLLALDGATYPLHTLTLRYDYFLYLDDTFYLIDQSAYRQLIQFFSQQGSRIVLHQSKYPDFQQDILAKLEEQVQIEYGYLKPATPAQLKEGGFNQTRQRIIYLEDGDQYVSLIPVMVYGNVEVPVLSKRQIHSVDSRGRPFTVKRDEADEIAFTMAVLSQHPDFQDQIQQNQFHLHKKHVLNEDWFLDAFETWTNQGIRILGFNKLKNNKLNPNKARISVLVSSGLDWFETALGVSFGKQNVSLRHLHKAVKNRSRFITLDDGTKGVLPAAWLERFAAYFQEGDVVAERIRTPKINFASLRDLYSDEQLMTDVQEQLALLTKSFASFQSVQPVDVPAALQATLRTYQKEGLNWLNFLDEFGFGGCLADDMGLGKTLQIIAFILLLKQKKNAGANLVVVPTSLLFNWQAEVAKFALGLKLHPFYGANRILNEHELSQYDIVLTSYGTLLSDIRFLKNYSFNYVFLDESQAIKNPESQRYHAARMLQSRNRIVLTGTPIENHTFDLYGQLSFACPGLLGSYTHFKAYYSTPIDKFGDQQRARELQKKINPFILRRTKAQVAAELPEKTEMVIHCPMSPEQRSVYDAYEREFRNYLLTTKEGDIPRERLHVLQGLTKLRQICNSPALINNDEHYGNASAKIDRLMEQIDSKSPQHKILVFSQFVSMLDLIRNELKTRQIGFEYLTGQTTDRAARVNRFQTDDMVRVFLISLKAGGTGLNLTQADYVYLVDPWWNPAVENQAIDRSYRIGQQKNVIAVRLICPDTIEEKILELQASKKELADTLVQTDTSILKSLTRADLLHLLRL